MCGCSARQNIHSNLSLTQNGRCKRSVCQYALKSIVPNAGFLAQDLDEIAAEEAAALKAQQEEEERIAREAREAEERIQREREEAERKGESAALLRRMTSSHTDSHDG